MKKFISLILTVVLASALVVGCGTKTADGDAQKIGVLIYNFDDTSLSSLRQALE